MNLNKTCFFASCVKIINSFGNGVAYGAHSNDDVLCIRSAVVIERLIIRADLFIYHVHIHNSGLYGIVIILVASLSVLEKDIRVFGRAAQCGMLRIQSVRSEALNIVHIHHGFKIFVIPDLDLLDLVRSTESVKEMKERHGRFQSGKMRNGTEIHNLLRVIGAEHCITCLTAGINIRMISENIERMRGNTACGYMDDRREKLAGNLIHIRDHKKKTL